MDQTLLPLVMDDNRTYEKTGVYKVLIASGQSDLEKLQCTVQLTMLQMVVYDHLFQSFVCTGLWINPAGKKIMRSKSRGHLSTKAWCDEPIMNVFHSPPHSISVPPLFCWGGQLAVPNFAKRGIRKKWVSGWALKSSCHGYFAGGLTMLLAKKRLLKIKYGFEGSISNVDLRLLQPNKQSMFSFVIFWFY